jgi:hypothetical protein
MISSLILLKVLPEFTTTCFNSLENFEDVEAMKAMLSLPGASLQSKL